ncbi:GDCCVxC domain-containing (seleno)protein [Beijerinckia sp. L45]|uniref:GDCCVxC domain-containing (seleno)protein n=1 Tax=Beijerinckia sp. L45 TaxID=1641855 RepID=UPI00131D6B56|nr:GDCCVxC domain-containing (seleno)protein [Beijerinckia sp. L45]
MITKEAITTRSTLTCPTCGTSQAETMPVNACMIRYDCVCGHTLRPKAGDCCVFCSYGTVPCPPIQEERRGGVSACCGTPARERGPT